MPPMLVIKDAVSFLKFVDVEITISKRQAMLIPLCRICSPLSDRKLLRNGSAITVEGSSRDLKTEQKLLPAAAPPSKMGELRLRITQTLEGSIDGIQLDRFLCGRVYDVRTLLACYLLAEGAAEPVDDDSPAEVLPPEKQMFAPSVQPQPKNGGVFEATPTQPSTVFPLAAAADRVPAGRRRTRKRR